jgi:hypothetical protein
MPSPSGCGIWRQTTILRPYQRVCLPLSTFHPGSGSHRFVACGDGHHPDPSNSSRPSPVENYETWPATAPPPRRLLIGCATALSIAIGGNLGGVTSSLLGVLEQ